MVTKSVWVVAYYFPPIATSGSMRPLGFCRYLGEYGWKPRVLTTDPECVYPPVGLDESVSDQILDTMQIDRVPHRNPERLLLHVRNMFRELLVQFHLLKENQQVIRNGQSEENLPAGFVRQYLAT